MGMLFFRLALAHLLLGVQTSKFTPIFKDPFGSQDSGTFVEVKSFVRVLNTHRPGKDHNVRFARGIDINPPRAASGASFYMVRLMAWLSLHFLAAVLIFR